MPLFNYFLDKTFSNLKFTCSVILFGILICEYPENKAKVCHYFGRIGWYCRKSLLDRDFMNLNYHL